MEGTLQIRNDDLFNLLDLLMRNLLERPTFLHQGALSRARRILRSISQFNSSGRAKKNAAHHYDLSHQFYRFFLDSDMQYSCAYFSNDADSIDQAQGKKKALIAKKLLIEPGHRVLDIGCGWGGMGLHLNRHHGAHVTGVTLSREQLEVAQRRASAESRRSTPEFRLEDYREVRGTFDRIVSVGMFEHVGTPHYREFFTHLKDRLASDGIALVHTIGRSGPPSATDAWTAKHIFPGGYCPALSEVATAVERSGLIITDVEVLRLHYARTLKLWRSRFETRLSDVRRLYDDRFCRMWRYYLTASELAFRRGGHVVFQLQLTRRQDVVPVTRDYLLDASGNSERPHCTEMPTAGVRVPGSRAGTRNDSGGDQASATPA
ncbi:MAG: cyclopropane-fatty-acyl-phospholipid synthase family protein [Pseudomonadota bacterium]